MKIKPAVYEQLTPPQRLIATFEALGRHDEDEVHQLFQSCPKLAYRVPDPSFTDPYDRILDIALSVEYELLQLTVQFLVSDKSEAGSDERRECLEAMGTLDGVWAAYLEEKGISKKSIEAILPRTPGVKAMVDDLWLPDPDTLPMRLAEFKTLMKAC